jgi:hypothetical protein
LLNLIDFEDVVAGRRMIPLSVHGVEFAYSLPMKIPWVVETVDTNKSLRRKLL